MFWNTTYDDIIPCTLNSISRGEKTKNSSTNSTAVDYSSSTNILILVHAARLFLFLFFPVQQTTSGIGHRVKYGVVFFGLATNALNVRIHPIICR